MSPRVYVWLERTTAAVLLLVLVALGWMTLAAWGPGWDGWATQEVQVLLVLALMTVALVLVSLTALLHTRS